jgi:hypothetical protein
MPQRCPSNETLLARNWNSTSKIHAYLALYKFKFFYIRYGSPISSSNQKWIPSTHAKKKSTILQEHWRGRRHWKTRKGVKLYAINITKLKHNKYHLGSWKKNRNSWGIQLRKNHPKSRFFFFAVGIISSCHYISGIQVRKKFSDQGERRPLTFSLKKLMPRLEPGLAQQTASLACPADQSHRESVGIQVRK